MLITVNDAVQRIFQNAPDPEPAATYAVQRDREARVRQLWPVVSVTTTEVVMRNTKKSMAPTLKAAGFRWSGSDWRLKAKNADAVIEALKKLDFEFLAATSELEKALLTKGVN